MLRSGASLLLNDGKREEASKLRNGSPAFASGRSAKSPLGHRLLSRSATLGDIRNSSEPRRSSFMSSSSMDRESVKSSMSDVFLPRAASNGQAAHTEPSHLHSAPLLLALLPAVGGIIFQNGSAVLTDITLLILAAIFLNWSVRLPWDWYHSAQAIYIRPEEAVESDSTPDDTILEERSGDEEEDNTGKKEGKVRSEREKVNKQNGSRAKRAAGSSMDQQTDAASELRIHEMLALFTCFLGPIFGAWLLHTIRYQLSRPSEGLVSDYNLSIFLLAAEIRPVSHVLKLVQARTLYLQRLVASNPHSEPVADATVSKELLARIDELEAHAATVASDVKPKSEQPKTPQVMQEVRKTIQPELDALNRAVRRYEKRATVFNMQIEAQLQDLDSRTKDALSLAAAAERGRKGSAAVLMDFSAALVVVPAQTLYALLLVALRLPQIAFESVARTIKIYFEFFYDITGLRRLGGKKKGKEKEKEREGPGKRKTKRIE